MLADDGIGGLHVMPETASGSTSSPGDALVINLGDLMDQRLPFHAEISCLPTCLAEGENPRYEPQKAGPYLLSRFDATHSYRNPLLAERE